MIPLILKYIIRTNIQGYFTSYITYVPNSIRFRTSCKSCGSLSYLNNPYCKYKILYNINIYRRSFSNWVKTSLELLIFLKNQPQNRTHILAQCHTATRHQISSWNFQESNSNSTRDSSVPHQIVKLRQRRNISMQNLYLVQISLIKK